MKDDKITVLECTLRDGSYLIDYQFTAEDTYIICTGLSRAGFKYIEIGHGTGMHSSQSGKGLAAESDEAYLAAASDALSGTDSCFGMFFIPGIGRIEDLETAARYGMDFIRIGTNVMEVEQAEPFIRRAKELGMYVASNLMKSYAVSIDEFLDYAEMADSFGADVITVVDSAGGMFPRDVREYVSRLGKRTGKKVGFHGHNNLHLAVANTLEALESGATVVDSTLQGMGRSAGNAQTEILVMALEKYGYKTGIDPYKAMDLGERVVRPMMKTSQGVDDMSIVSGIAQFHSSYSKIIEEAAQRHRIDPRLLIIEVSERNRVDVTPELADAIALELAACQSTDRGFSESSQFLQVDYILGRNDGGVQDKAARVARTLKSEACKTGKESVLSLTLASRGETVFAYVRQSASMVIGNCEAADAETLQSIVNHCDGIVDWILFDSSKHEMRKAAEDLHPKMSQLAWYSEKRALLLAIATLVTQTYRGGRIVLFGDNSDVQWLALELKHQGLTEVISGMEGPDLDAILTGCKILVSLGVGKADVLESRHAALVGDTRIYAAEPGAFPEGFWCQAMKDGLDLYRVDSRTGLAVEIFLTLETQRQLRDLGRGEIAGVPVVSGGVVGTEGTVVLDSMVKPGRVLGLADGRGGLMRDAGHYKADLQQVQSALIQQRLKMNS